MCARTSSSSTRRPRQTAPSTTSTPATWSLRSPTGNRQSLTYNISGPGTFWHNPPSGTFGGRSMAESALDRAGEPSGRAGRRAPGELHDWGGLSQLRRQRQDNLLQPSGDDHRRLRPAGLNRLCPLPPRPFAHGCGGRQLPDPADAPLCGQAGVSSVSAVTSWKAGEVATTLGAGFARRANCGVFLTYVRKLGSSDALRNSGSSHPDDSRSSPRACPLSTAQFGVEQQPRDACGSVPRYCAS